MQSPVPPRFRDLYDSLEAKLNDFEATVDEQWSGARARTLFSSEALCANGNRGLKLLEPGAMQGVQVEIDRLHSLGVSAINIALNFPLLYEPFWQWSGTPQYFRQFVEFYRDLVRYIHECGLRVVVDNCMVFTGYYSSGSGIDVADYYKTLSMQELVECRAETAVTTTDEVGADYLNLGSEPDTQAAISGHEELKTPEGWAEFVGSIAKHIRSESGKVVPIGAGVGSWTGNGSDYIDALAKAKVDIIDIHVYPINHKFLLPRLEELINQALCLGKRVAIGEAWLQKQRDEELGVISAGSGPLIYSRDAFDFWAPLDQQFLCSLVKFSHWKNLEYFSAFWSRYFWSYLPYSECRELEPEQIVNRATAASGAAMANGETTSTAEAYREAIAV